MTETGKSFEICTREEFEKFKSIHERFKEFLKDPVNISGEEQGKIGEDIEAFWPRIVEIGQSYEIDLSDKLEILQDILANW